VKKWITDGRALPRALAGTTSPRHVLIVGEARSVPMDSLPIWVGQTTASRAILSLDPVSLATGQPARKLHKGVVRPRFASDPYRHDEFGWTRPKRPPVPELMSHLKVVMAMPQGAAVESA